MLNIPSIELNIEFMIDKNLEFIPVVIHQSM